MRQAVAPVFAAVFVLAYVGFFMVGLGPGFWLALSEIFPNRAEVRLYGWGFAPYAKNAI